MYYIGTPWGTSWGKAHRHCCSRSPQLFPQAQDSGEPSMFPPERGRWDTEQHTVYCEGGFASEDPHPFPQIQCTPTFPNRPLRGHPCCWELCPHREPIKTASCLEYPAISHTGAGGREQVEKGAVSFCKNDPFLTVTQCQYQGLPAPHPGRVQVKVNYPSANKWALWICAVLGWTHYSREGRHTHLDNNLKEDFFFFLSILGKGTVYPTESQASAPHKISVRKQDQRNWHRIYAIKRRKFYFSII